MRSVEYLGTPDAAAYLGFVKADGTPNLRAFYNWMRRHKPKTHKLGDRLRFRRVDLDKCIEVAK